MFELGSTKAQIHDSDKSYFFEILKNTNDKNEKFHSPLEEVCAMKICQKCAVGRCLRNSREPNPATQAPSSYVESPGSAFGCCANLVQRRTFGKSSLRKPPPTANEIFIFVIRVFQHLEKITFVGIAYLR